MTKSGNICLATVTTRNYIQWTMTMFFSFCKSNPWFKGDFVVISPDLTTEDKSRFDIFSNVRFVNPSDVLLSRVHQLIQVIPGFARLAPMFYSLEAFCLSGYSRVLFLDSDMLVVKSVREIIDFPGPFGASAESCWYQGKGRRIDTYEAVENYAVPQLFLENPVNSGFMILDESVLTTSNYDGLVGLIEPGLWANKSTLHADQLIINLYFRDMIQLVDARYNYRPTIAAGILTKEGFRLDAAKIIHYYRQYKPWNFGEVLDLSQHDMVHIEAFRLWYTHYVEFLKYNHLKQKINFLNNNDTDHS
ncbi:MAG: glycosyltransferase [Bacteroidales bacterium]